VDGQAAADTDFQLDSWLRALQDLGEEQPIATSASKSFAFLAFLSLFWDAGDDRGWQQPGIGKIRVERDLDRACRVRAVSSLLFSSRLALYLMFSRWATVEDISVVD
jgi:hypothetical protein